MPVVYDFHCQTKGCQGEGIPFESMLRSWDSPDPNCPYCQQSLIRHLSCPAPVYLKPYAQYGNDKGKENYAADKEGIYVYRTKSSRNADGTPERVRLTTRAEVKEYCRQEQLMMPDEMNPNVTVGADGKTMDTHGLKGQWV